MPAVALYSSLAPPIVTVCVISVSDPLPESSLLAGASTAGTGAASQGSSPADRERSAMSVSSRAIRRWGLRRTGGRNAPAQPALGFEPQSVPASGDGEPAVRLAEGGQQSVETPGLLSRAFTRDLKSERLRDGTEAVVFVYGLDGVLAGSNLFLGYGRRERNGMKQLSRPAEVARRTAFSIGKKCRRNGLPTAPGRWRP